MLLVALTCSMNVWSWTYSNNYTIEAKFKINAVAAGLIFAAPSANDGDFYMWQFNVSEAGNQSKFRPHHWNPGACLAEIGTADKGVTLNASDWFETKIVITENGTKATTYLRKVGDAEYVLIEENREGTFTYGHVGARMDHEGSTNESATFDYIKVTDNVTGIVLYNEDFNTTNGNWSNTPTWDETNGTLTVTGVNLSERRYFQNYMYKENMHYAVEADMTIESGYISLVFGLADSGTSYMWQISPNFSDDNTIVYYHLDKGNENWKAHAAGSSFPDFNGAALLGTKRHVKIEVIGNVVKTFIDGSLEDTFTQNDLVDFALLNPGRIGVRADASNNIHHKAYIDNLKVTEYDGETGTVVMEENFDDGISRYFDMAAGASVVSVNGDYALLIDAVKSTSSEKVRLIQKENPYNLRYLYNVGSDLWLQNNDKNTTCWTTRAELGERGMIIGVSEISGGYQLNPFFGGNHSINSGNLYMDTSEGMTAWTITPISDTGYVYIKSGENYLGSDGSGYLTIGSLTGDDAKWRLYTAEERKQQMLAGTIASPTDATWLISSPNFAWNDERGNIWTEVTSGGNNDLDGDNPGNGGVCCNRVHESFNCGIYSMTQILTTLPAGVYRMSVQGFYNCSDLVKRPYYFVQNATSGTIQKDFMLVSEDVHSDPNCWGSATDGGAYGQFYAAKCIYYGHYQNPDIYFVVGSDNEATTIGVKKESFVSEDWLIYDNFKLEYLGSQAETTIGAANYTTFVAPYNISTIPTGVEAYACQVQTNYVHLEPVTAIPTGEAVVMKNTGTYSFFPASGDVVLGTNNDLKASNGTQTGGDGIYALANKGMVGFYPVDNGVTIPAGKGYLNLGGSGVKAFYGFEEENATSINSLTPALSEVEGTIYNLAGQRVGKLQKGINIVNGKKIIK